MNWENGEEAGTGWANLAPRKESEVERLRAELEKVRQERDAGGFCDKHKPNASRTYDACWACSRDESEARLQEALTDRQECKKAWEQSRQYSGKLQKRAEQAEADLSEALEHIYKLIDGGDGLARVDAEKWAARLRERRGR